MKVKSLSLFNFLFGLVLGILLGGSLSHETFVIISKVVFFLSILVIAVFGRQIRIILHSNYLKSWEVLRNRSKWYFVVTRYIVLRGSVLFILFVLPLVLSSTLSRTVVVASIISFVLIAAVQIYFGLEEWTNCEQEYSIQLIRKIGERVRIDQE